MPYKNPEDRKRWLAEHPQADYLRAWRRGERKRHKPKLKEPAHERTQPHERTLKEPIERPRVLSPVEEPKPASTLPKAIYTTPPPLTKTHRFEIRTRLKRPVSPTSLQHASVRSRGKGGRIQYAEVRLENSTVEIFSQSARIYSTNELLGLDRERVEGMKKALKVACSFRGAEPEPEEKWHVGEFSHTTMEDKSLDEVLRPLALQEVGDDNYHLFADDGSHPGKVESAGKENWTGTNLLYHVLFELPVENARQIAVFGEYIKQHFAVLGGIQAGIGELTSVVKELRDAIKELKEAR